MTNDERMTKSEGQNARADDSFWDDGAELVREEPETKRVYDLEERTARFGEAIIDFAKTIPQNPVTNRIITQLVGAGTSVGANYAEADDAVSKKEFLKNIGTCRKEAREIKHFRWMIEPNYGMGFLLKPLQALRIAGKAHGEKFERGLAARRHVGGQIDVTHPAGADRFRNFVVADRLADERISLPILNDFGRETNSRRFNEGACSFA